MEKKKCVECGAEFELNEAEIDYYSRKIVDRKFGSPTYGQEIQMFPPKRCKTCREQRKHN